MIFEVSTRSLIGLFEHRIVRAGCRRLNCRTTSMGKYNKLLESLMLQNRMDDCLDKVLEEIANDTPTAAQQRRMDILDKQFVQLQKHASQTWSSAVLSNCGMRGFRPTKPWFDEKRATSGM